MKKTMIGMAAAAAVLFGMASCGHKAENAENAEVAETTENADAAAVEESVVEQQEGAVAEEAVAAAEVAAAEEGAPAEVVEYTATPSGLKYKVLKKGNGKKPKATDIVKVNYEGKLTNGQIFDSSYQRGTPAEFPLNRVIPGWTEGLQLMPEGSVYEFYIPYNLAYGERGAGDMIPPKSDLIFKVELIEVK